MKTIFHTISDEYAEQALNILEKRHNRLRSTIPIVPRFEDFSELKEMIRDLFSLGNGIAATKGTKLMGYLAGYPVEQFFGKDSGVYCPLFGFGIVDDENKLTASALYEEASRLWVKNNKFTHALTIFSDEAEERDDLFWSGFGMRCVDAIAPTTTIYDINIDHVKIVQSEAGLYQKALGIHRNSNRFYRTAPIFMPNLDFDYEKEQIEWNAEKGNIEWLAMKDAEIVGMTRISEKGETYISQHQSIRNIKDTFVSDAVQQKGVGKKLLATIFQHLKEHDVPLCGVDFESINPKARRFWLKYFTPYTFSMVRRVDERISETQ